DVEHHEEMVSLTAFFVNQGSRLFPAKFAKSMACRRIVKLRRCLLPEELEPMGEHGVCLPLILENSMPSRARRAFILIGLLVGIIAILAAIMFPVFARAREKARQR